MEDWPADARNPVGLSANRMQGCDFCIALIAFRRGTVALNDPARRSITQIEIDTATRIGASVLVFLLRDSPENRAHWPAPLNELADPDVVRWRMELQRFTCEFFDHDQTPNVLPAVTRGITAREQRRRRSLVAVLGVASALIVLTSIAIAASGSTRRLLLSRLLAYDDPKVFSYSRDGQYKIARLLDGRGDMRDNANFREELRATRKSFSIYATTFESLVEYEPDFDALAARGVIVRIVFVDFAESNRATWEPFLKAKGDAKTGTMADFVQTGPVDVVKRLAAKYPGSIEVRLSTLPIFFTCWIRDANEPNELSHLGVNYYSSVGNWPYLRFSGRTGGTQARQLADQFEIIWQQATPLAGHAERQNHSHAVE